MPKVRFQPERKFEKTRGQWEQSNRMGKVERKLKRARKRKELGSDPDMVGSKEKRRRSSHTKSVYSLLDTLNPNCRAFLINVIGVQRANILVTESSRSPKNTVLGREIKMRREAGVWQSKSSKAD